MMMMIKDCKMIEIPKGQAKECTFANKSHKKVL